MIRKILTSHGQNKALEVDVVVSLPQHMLEKLQDRLQKGVIVFEYYKADGSQRRAIGTLNPKLLAKLAPPKPADKVEGAKSKVPNDSVQIYYDLEADAFRSFNWDTLLAIYE